MLQRWLRYINIAVLALFMAVNLKQDLNGFLSRVQSPLHGNSNSRPSSTARDNRHLQTSADTATATAATNSSNSSSMSSYQANASSSRTPIEIPPSSPFAYVFYLGGVTSSDDNDGGSTNKDGLLYNILVSVQILRDSGSTADMVLLVHTVSELPTTTTVLSKKHECMLHKLGVRIRYTPKSKLDPTNYFGTVALEKFRIFSWIEYSRILFMDADIMPHCNLDYLFHNSMDDSDATLQPNVLISIGDQPASPSFFLIQPVKGRYERFLQMVANLPSQSQHKNRMKVPKAEWTSLKMFQQAAQAAQATKASSQTTTNTKSAAAISGEQEPRSRRRLKPTSYWWDFAAMGSDVGLLYAFMRFRIRRGISIVVGDQVYTLTGELGNNKLGKPSISPIHQQSCLNQINQPALADQEYHSRLQPDEKQWMSPSGVAPYQDIALWSHDQVKPWNIEDPAHAAASYGATQQWFQVLSKLDKQHELGLGLVQGNFVHPKSSSSYSANIIPLGGIAHQASKVWAQQQQQELGTKNTHPIQLEQLPLLVRSSSSSDSYRQKRAFVCVTGQLERLELHNKIERLLKPIQQRGYQLDVALVVTDGQSVYTNHDKDSHNKTHAPFYSTYADALRDLARQGIHNVLSTKSYAMMEDPPFFQRYYERLNEHQKEVRSPEHQKERVLNHARIFDSYNRCLEYATQAAQKAAASSSEQQHKQSTTTPSTAWENYYDVLFRIRDDVGFEHDLPESVLTDLLEPSPGSIQVTGCRCWHGMNDRFASVSPGAAKIYFTRLYHNYVQGLLHDAVTKVYNPETYLLSTFVQAGVHVLANRDFKGLSKMIMNDKGEAIFAPDDVDNPKCLFEKDPYLDHLIDLYGWAF